MTIRELLKDYIATDSNQLLRAIHQSHLNRVLEQELIKMSKTDKTIEFLLYIFKQQNIQFTVETLIQILEQFNIKTVKDYIKWGKSINNIDIIKIIEMFLPKYPKITDDELIKITSSEFKKHINTLIPNQYKIEKLSINFQDVHYYIPSLQLVKDILELSKVDKLHYVKEKFDCESFALNLQCYISRAGYDNLTICDIEVNLYSKNFEKITGAHALNLCIYYENNKENIKACLIEPQTDRIIQFGEPVITTKYYKIRKIFTH